ncbi:MAG: hypothetical protein ACRDJN_07370 [Chloroflexota bacterium]
MPVEGVQTLDYFGYAGCLALENAGTRVVLGHHCGGRVLEYAWQGQNALYLDPAQAGWTYTPAPPDQVSAERQRPERPVNPTGGRCDIGPEHVIPRHPMLWIGPWTAEAVGPRHARLASADDPATGTRLVRDFTLDPATSRLTFTQTIINVSDHTTQCCHWGRTFARHGGIGIVPLTPGSRFPKGYVMYGPGPAINFRPDDPNIVRRGDFLEIRGVPQQPKLGFDSYAGWFAYLLPGDLLFVKRFATFPDRVYNEVAALTSCIYYPSDRFCELEPIGPRESLAPGESAAFTEEWWLLPYRFPAAGQALDLYDVAARVAAAR